VSTGRIEAAKKQSTVLSFNSGIFQLEKEMLHAIVYARAMRPATPASKAKAGLPLELAAPVKVATGGAE